MLCDVKDCNQGCAVIGWSEGSQTVGSPRCVAARIVLAVGPGGIKVTTGRRSLLIDGATDRFADHALQRLTARLRLTGALHGHQRRVDGLYQVFGYRAARERCFSPEERHAKMRAAGTTGNARTGRHDPPNGIGLRCSAAYRFLLYCQYTGKALRSFLVGTEALSLNRTAVFNDLVDRGADWCDVLFGASLNDEQCIAALIRLGGMQASWAAFFLSTYAPSQIVEYASTEEKADGVYKLVPHGFLLDRISEHRRVAVLERDLGL